MTEIERLFGEWFDAWLAEIQKVLDEGGVTAWSKDDLTSNGPMFYAIWKAGWDAAKREEPERFCY